MSTNATSGLSTLAKSKASVLANWQGTSVSGGNSKLFINGKFEESKTDKWMDVHDPVRHSLIYLYMRTHLLC